MDISDDYWNDTELTNYNDTADRNKTGKFGPGSEEWFVASIITAWILTVLTIVLNSAVIWVILKNRKRTTLYFLLMNMAAADLCTGMLDTLVQSIERTTGYMVYGTLTNAWLADSVTCKLQKLLGNASCVASNCILAVTSFDRALVVAKPMTTVRRGNVLRKTLIIGCWVISFLTGIPMLFDFTTMPLRNTAVINCHFTQETIPYEVYIHIQFVFIYMVPLVTIVVSYAILIRAIFQRSRMMVGQSMSYQFSRGLPRSKIKSIKLMCGIVAGFLISWTPYFIAAYIDTYHVSRGPWRAVFYQCYYVNGITNPVMFFIYHHRRTRLCSTPTSNDMQSKTTSFYDGSNGDTQKRVVSQETEERLMEDSDPVKDQY